MKKISTSRAPIFTILFALTFSCFAQSPMDLKFKRLTNAYKVGNIAESCRLSSQILGELPNTQEFARARNLVEMVQGETCYKVYQQQLDNNPQCINYKNAKVRCAPAADYSACMKRLGASPTDYAFICGE